MFKSDKQGKPVQVLQFCLLYRKLRKSSKMVYNKSEIKNGMTKERREDFAMTLFMRFFYWLDCTG